MSAPTTSSPSPNTATVVLPPGLTLDQYLTLQGDAVAFAIIIWDYFILLPDELVLYTDKDKRISRAPTTIFFIVLRYSAFLATLPSLFFTSVQNQHCQAAVILSQVGACLVVSASGAIFCLRVSAMWHGNRAVYALVTTVFLTMVSCWIAVATQYSATTGPPTPLGSNCQMHPIVSWAPISFGSSVLFDSTILLLTIAKLPRTWTTKSHIGRQIFRDTLMYFTLSTVTNIVVLSIQALGEAHAMIKPTAVPFATVMTATMGSRVYLNLRLLEIRRQAEAERIPLGVPFAVPRPGTDRTKDATSGATHVESFLTARQAPGSMNSKKNDSTIATGQSGYSLDIERPL
ncbi:uncharacterized protein PHACADRAFT_197544 [Phanerochaete carnosa HHB-10118-sp]|uniref:DUF6533 domain-containing protein n=1 Tax=Phanerochaete carnosa (strain HHB-10118-sp) TaxID=650164 RepID=K5W2H2_PHACS|nr:uncharacterized protein PHACADRAFT_197544 [Phanerochaete carnosa HHB-10118-sp]EKM53114.1 hypothetical protein PHACADRAFT_197544 [Phanerochaete carnosa HHB-10118-sp]